MPGHFPGPLGFAAFGGIKLAGYTAAGTVLRRVFPGTSAGALKIGAVRTGIGILIGVSHLALWVALYRLHGGGDPGAIPFIVSMFALRFAIWIGVIRFFCDAPWLKARTLLYALAGALLSFVLDALGMALALITPGQVPVC